MNTTYGIEPKNTFLWQTQEGEVMSVKEMTTSHIFHSLRMIYNHTVPEGYRIKFCREHFGIYDWSAEARKKSINAFLVELKQRQDIPKGMLEQLYYMRDCVRILQEQKLWLEE